MVILRTCATAIEKCVNRSYVGSIDRVIVITKEIGHKKPANCRNVKWGKEASLLHTQVDR
jgi:hypothetical protein